MENTFVAKSSNWRNGIITIVNYSSFDNLVGIQIRDDKCLDSDHSVGTFIVWTLVLHQPDPDSPDSYRDRTFFLARAQLQN